MPIRRPPRPSIRPIQTVTPSGIRLRASSRRGKTVLEFGPPRRGCGGLSGPLLRDAAHEAAVAVYHMLEDDGVRSEVLTEKGVRGPRSLHAPITLVVSGVVPKLSLIGMAVEEIAYHTAFRTTSLRQEPIKVTPVTLTEAIEEAERQEQFQLPRRFGMYERAPQTADGARRTAIGTTRLLKREGAEQGGYVLAHVPIAWIYASLGHVDPDRQERQAMIGGTSDPAFSIEWGRNISHTHNGSGPVLYLVNGNNRVHYARQHGRTHYPVLVTRKAWDGLMRAIRNERALGESVRDVDCAARQKRRPLP